MFVHKKSKKKEIKEAGEAIKRNNGGKNPILGF